MLQLVSCSCRALTRQPSSIVYLFDVPEIVAWKPKAGLYQTVDGRFAIGS